MKFSILQQDLLPVVGSVIRSIGTKITLPVLANILIKAENSKLKISATNLETGIIKFINADVAEEGELTVPAKTFFDLISSLGSEKINMEAQGDLLKISTKNFNATMNGISASEFPAIPTSSEQGIFIDGETFFRSLPQVTFAAAADEGRPILTGILTEFKKDSIEIVATDGFRLAHKLIKIGSAGNQTLRVLIPKKTLEEVVRIISDETQDKAEKLEISTSDNQNQIIFKMGQTTLSSRLIEGQFPSWDKIIPQKTEQRTVISKDDFLKGCKLASVFAKGDANTIKIETGDNKIKLFSEAKESGFQETEIEAQTEGEKITIAFNSKYIIDVLNACPATQISIEFSGNVSACVIKPLGEDILEYVIMPIRLS